MEIFSWFASLIAWHVAAEISNILVAAALGAVVLTLIGIYVGLTESFKVMRRWFT